MGKASDLSLEKRAQLKILAVQDKSHRDIANILNVSKSAVTRGLAKMKELGSLKSRNRSGRPRVTTAASDRLIRCAAVANPSSSSKRIALELQPVTVGRLSPRTVRRRLLTNFKLPSRKPAKKSRLSKKNVKDCMKYTGTGPSLNDIQFCFQTIRHFRNFLHTFVTSAVQ